MRPSETADLLTLISGIDRRQFPEGAADAWHEILSETDYRDAKAAVLEYFSGGSDDVPTLIPGRVRTGAQRFKAARLRNDTPAVEAVPVKPAAQVRSAAFLKAQAEIRKATAEAEAKLREADPARRPYRHRETLLTSVS